MLNIIQPTLILDKKKAFQNIENMVKKARANGVRFRPHFKTHQSAQIGEWYKNSGVKSITTSSLDMALYFAKNGWDDINVAFPVNILEIDKINDLAKTITLHLLVESKETVRFLEKNVKSHVNLWIKIDIGYSRTGILWRHPGKTAAIAKTITNAANLSFNGILTHSGHSYKARSKKEVEQIYSDTVSRMQGVRNELISKGFEDCELSVGDTPTCSIVDNLNGVDEIRPGNFVFYDVTQNYIGSCSKEQIAVSVACPVVAKHKERNEIIIYGGAIHLSKDFILGNDGKKNFGLIAFPNKNGWESTLKNTYISALSQEHGIVKTDENIFNRIHVGDILMVLPIHSCLTTNLLKKYITLEGETIEMAEI